MSVFNRISGSVVQRLGLMLSVTVAISFMLAAASTLPYYLSLPINVGVYWLFSTGLDVDLKRQIAELGQ